MTVKIVLTAMIVLIVLIVIRVMLCQCLNLEGLCIIRLGCATFQLHGLQGFGLWASSLQVQQLISQGPKYLNGGYLPKP